MNKLLFPFSTCFALLLLVGIVIWLGVTLVAINEMHQKKYQDLVALTDSTRNKKITPYTATQQHRQTRKDFFFIQKGQRLHMQVISGDTELVLDHHGGTTDAMEKMKDVTCLMQEELFYLLPDGQEVICLQDGKVYKRGDSTGKELQTDLSLAIPMQVFRYLKADEAKYYYQTEKFVSTQTEISRFSAPGHILVQEVNELTPSMKGIAQSVEFFTLDGIPQFTAYQLKAVLND